MNEKPNLLVVYNYNRHDFLSYFHSCKHDFNFYFAEFVSPQEEKNKIYKAYGQAIYWSNFNDVFQLLDTIKPSKVLFHYIESNFHVLLNVACKIKGIPTFIIDHGLRDININIRLKNYLTPQAKAGRWKRFTDIIFTLLPRLKARRYLLNSLYRTPLPHKADLRSYISDRNNKANTYITEPTDFIAISTQTFNYYKHYYKLPEYRKAHYIGIPTFDVLTSAQALISDRSSKKVLFIDQGLAQVGVFGWTSAEYNKFLGNFIQILTDLGYYLYIKPHPRQNFKASKLFNTNTVSIVDDESIKEILPQVSIVIGFTSTYLLPIIAFPHTSVLTLENHPAGKLNVSKSLIDARVAHPIYDISKELPHALENIQKIHQQQLPHKAKFTAEWMYKFDGKSGERLKNILLSD